MRQSAKVWSVSWSRSVSPGFRVFLLPVLTHVFVLLPNHLVPGRCPTVCLAYKDLASSLDLSSPVPNTGSRLSNLDYYTSL